MSNIFFAGETVPRTLETKNHAESLDKSINPDDIIAKAAEDNKGKRAIASEEVKAPEEMRPSYLKYHFFELPKDSVEYETVCKKISEKKYSFAKEIVRDVNDDIGSIAIHLFLTETRIASSIH